MVIEKDESFLLAERYVRETGLSLFLTGKAGTGKTTFLRHIVESCDKRCAVVAPTGVAAINAGGVTIHSFFQLPLCPYLPDVKELVTEYQLPQHKTHLRRERIDILRSLDLLIIDEVSMVRADLMDAMDMMLRRYRRADKPFGGVQLLMIGDVQQLPPVVTEAEKVYFDKVYPSPFFFNSKALAELPYIVIELSKVHRQSDLRFVELLNDVRGGRPSAETISSLNSRLDTAFDPPDNEKWIRLCTHNAQADSINRRKMALLNGKSRDYDCIVEGNFPENSYPAEQKLTLKPGAQVMFIRNDASQANEYYNGKLATVESVEPELSVVDSEGRHIKVKMQTWENIRYELNPESKEIEAVVDGSFCQIPLRLAWAITIHKSQGLSFDKVLIDAAMAFSAGQVYVALSRCRSLEGIVLSSPIIGDSAFSSDEVCSYEKGYTPFEQAKGIFDQWKSEYFLEKLCAAFDLDRLRYFYNRVNRVYQVNLPNSFSSQAAAFKEISVPGLFGKPEEFAGIKALYESSRIFIKQLRRMSAEGCTVLLNERIAKAAAYYLKHLRAMVPLLKPLILIKIENKDNKKAFEEQALPLLKELNFRLCLYKSICENGFVLKDFQRLHTEMLLNNERGLRKHFLRIEKLCPKN